MTKTEKRLSYSLRDIDALGKVCIPADEKEMFLELFEKTLDEFDEKLDLLFRLLKLRNEAELAKIEGQEE